MTTSEYRKGFTDGLSQGPKVDAALKAPDGTAYLCVGGPKDGEYVKTMGIAEFMVPDYYISYSAQWMASYGGVPLSTDTISVGSYIRKDGIDKDGRRRTIYSWAGYR